MLHDLLCALGIHKFELCYRQSYPATGENGESYWREDRIYYCKCCSSQKHEDVPVKNK